MNGNLESLLGGKFVAGENLESSIEVKQPTFESPEKTFENSISEEIEVRARQLAFEYNQLHGRFDPFNLDVMRASVGTFSVLIRKPIITYQDACDHAVALTGLWKEEDSELKELREAKSRQKEIEDKTNILKEGTKEYEIEQARVAWREAVKKRNEIVEEWNKYVEILRTRYRDLRGQ